MMSVNPNLMKPAEYPECYYHQIQPVVSQIAAEMDDMTVLYPTQEMYDMMLDRVYNDLCRMFPEMEEEDRVIPGENTETVQASFGFYDDRYDRHRRRRRFLRDLLGILLLHELLRRRRYY